MKQLSGPDAMYLYTETDGFPMHIGGVSIYDQSTCPDGKVRFKDILAMFEGRLDRSPIFRRKLAEVPFVLDTPYWIDDENFDLEFHVRHIALPKPGDWRQLCIQVARLHARPLDRGRPLWEAYIIEGLNNVEGVPKGSFALYTKVHHSAIDGHSGVQFFGAFNDMSPEPPESEPPAKWNPENPPTVAKLLGKAYWNSLRKPGQFLSLGRKIMHPASVSMQVWSTVNSMSRGRSPPLVSTRNSALTGWWMPPNSIFRRYGRSSRHCWCRRRLWQGWRKKIRWPIP